MERLILSLLGLCVLIGTGFASSVPHAAQGFEVKFYSDGTYEATAGSSTTPVFGTWTTADGFFSLPATPEGKKLVGTCQFSEDKTFGCQGVPRTWQEPDGSMRGVGGGVFAGLNYSGRPGGQIKALPAPSA